MAGDGTDFTFQLNVAVERYETAASTKKLLRKGKEISRGGHWRKTKMGVQPSQEKYDGRTIF